MLIAGRLGNSDQQTGARGGGGTHIKPNSISHTQLVKICIYPFQTFCNMWAGVISMYTMYTLMVYIDMHTHMCLQVHVCLCEGNPEIGSLSLFLYLIF